MSIPPHTKASSQDNTNRLDQIDRPNQPDPAEQASEPASVDPKSIFHRQKPLIDQFGLKIQNGYLVLEVQGEVHWEPPTSGVHPSPTGPVTKIIATHKTPEKEWERLTKPLDKPDSLAVFMEEFLAEGRLRIHRKIAKTQELVHRILEMVRSPKNRIYLEAIKSSELSRDLQELIQKGYPLSFTGTPTWSLKNASTRVETLFQKIRSLLADAQLDELAARLKGHEEFQFKKRTLRKKFVVEIPVGASVMPLKNEIIQQISQQDLERYLDLTPDLLIKELEASFKPALAEFRASVEEQVAKLYKKIKHLPHTDLLTDDAVVTTITPYFTRRDEPFRKRHARDALVAVEERAREAKYRDDVFRLEEHRAEYADVARYYPLARSLGRKLILYVGPTNSGKTWRALNDLALGESGAYLAPLRLLALEGQEEMEKRGKPTSYITGEEREIRPGAQFVSSTIEMLDLDRPIDRVVIDEVQLLADERRGWAWLAAFVGAPASRVIMTGSPDCVAMVRWLASYLGEDLEIVDCQRYNELKVADVPSQLHNLPTATAVVCFSRRDVLTIKAQIEETSKHRVAVVYGNLSPQVRREEARRFRSGEADILVATDAIAMGLNLPIHQVVFFKTEKYDGETTRPLEYSEIRQIAGRAGRYGFAQFGVASALTPQALNLVRMAIRSPQKPLEPTFYVAPGPNHVRIIGKVLGTDSLERILTFFEKAMDFSNPSFARANIDELSFLSSYIDEALPHMTPVERLGIACAPVDLKSDTVLGWFLERMVPAFGAALDTAEPEENPDFLDDLFEDADRFSVGSAPGSMELRRAEDYLKSLTVYAWLAYRYSHVFPRIDDCQKSREIVNAYIERSLRSGVVRRCTGCKKQLPAIHPYRQCEECFQKTKKTRFQYSGNDRRRRS